ncbi:MAG: fumarylacetoacetate hydrolase family protein [Candidatus Methylomirabilales bacterium]
MRLVRFSLTGRIAYGVCEGGTVQEISTTPFLPFEKTGSIHALSEIRLLAPCLPSKVVAIALNYRDHAAETGAELPEVPVFFFKPSTSVVGPRDAIHRPPGCRRLDYEGELCVVIGSVARSVSESRWGEVVLGYTCGIDATARDFQSVDNQWGRAKGFDTSAPLGPWIETDLDPSDLWLVTRVNGEVRQNSRTSQLVFSVPELVAFVSSFITLLPGDVVMTGTPAGIGPLHDGDRVEVSIEGIGTLEASVQVGPR